jgi:hypothetical protein
MSEIMTTIRFARQLYQQLKQKPNFDPDVGTEIIKTITSGIDPKYHDDVAEFIVGRTESLKYWE